MTKPYQPSSTSPYTIVPGATLMGRYVAEEPFGFGGTAMVWKGHTTSSHQPVAIKVPHGHKKTSNQHEERLERESQILSRICSPYIVSIHDFGHLPDGRPIAVFEYMEGMTLRDYLKDRVTTDLIEGLTITRELVRALMDAHACGIVHRDIKPDNIMIQGVTENGQVRLKLFDFGIAKLVTEHFDGVTAQEDPEVAELFTPLTAAEMTVGTPEYMAPEQISASNLGAFTDLYAVGIVLHEMLFGVVPYTGKTFFEIAHRHLEGILPPLPADLPQCVQDLIWRSLACDVFHRYSTAEEMLDDIDTALRVLSGQETAQGAEDSFADDFGPWGMADDEPIGLEEEDLPAPLYTAAYGDEPASLSISQAASLWESTRDEGPQEDPLTHGGLAVPFSPRGTQRMRREGPVLDQLECGSHEHRSTRQNWAPWTVKSQPQGDQASRSGFPVESLASRDILGSFIFIEDDAFEEASNDFEDSIPTLVRSSRQRRAEAVELFP